MASAIGWFPSTESLCFKSLWKAGCGARSPHHPPPRARQDTPSRRASFFFGDDPGSSEMPPLQNSAAAAPTRETTSRLSRLRTMRFALSYMRNERVRANELGAAMQASQGLRYLGGCGEVNTRARPSRPLSTTRPKRECPAWGDFIKYRLWPAIILLQTRTPPNR